MRLKFELWVIVVVMFMQSSLARAEQNNSDVLERVKELEHKVETIEDERMLSGGGDNENPVSFHGYAELHYNNVQRQGNDDELDLHRAVIGLGYRFNDKFIFDVEVDFEHAATEIELEFAKLDWLIRPEINLRFGDMLMPMGPLNEFHEPPGYMSVERALVYKSIIPTTWQEGGLGIFGTFKDKLRYRAYLTGGLKLKPGSKLKEDGIRSWRQHVAEGSGEDIAAIGRFEYIGVPGVQIGSSIYAGKFDQDNTIITGSTLTMWDVDLRASHGPWRLDAVYAENNISKASSVVDALTTMDVANGTSLGTAAQNASIGSRMIGWHTELAYDILNPFFFSKNNKLTRQDLFLWMRYEEVNTQKSLSSNAVRDPASHRQILTGGVTYKPLPEVAFKMDYQDWEDDSPGSAPDKFQMGVGIEY